MPKVTGLNGLAIAMAVAGSVLLTAGIRNATVPDTLRALLKNTPIPSKTEGSLAEIGGALLGGPVLGSGVLGERIAQTALAEKGKPYKWATGGPNSFDCSGLVNWVLGHQLGLPIPGHTDGKYSGHGPTSGQYYLWAGVTTVKRPPQAGDLICYIGHIAIAISPTQMVHAPTSGDVVRVRNIYWTPQALVRRVKGA